MYDIRLTFLRTIAQSEQDLKICDTPSTTGFVPNRFWCTSDMNIGSAKDLINIETKMSPIAMRCSDSSGFVVTNQSVESPKLATIVVAIPIHTTNILERPLLSFPIIRIAALRNPSYNKKHPNEYKSSIDTIPTPYCLRSTCGYVGVSNSLI